MKKVMFLVTLCGVFFIMAGTVSAQVSDDARFESGKYYRLTSQFLGQGKSLDVTNDNSNLVVLEDTGNYTGQSWRIEKLANGYYRLTTQFRGKDLSLDVINDGAKNRLHLAKTGDYSGQFWKIQKLSGGAYRLTTAFQGDGKSLDVINDGQKRNVQLAATGNYTGQSWLITEVNSVSGSGNQGKTDPKVVKENDDSEVNKEDKDQEDANPVWLKGYTGQTTKRELIVTLPFSGPQKLIVEVASDGTVIFQGDMILGNISDFARYDPRPTDANSLIWSHSFIPYLIKANYSRRDLTLAGIKVPDFTSSNPLSSNANSRVWANSTIPYVLPADHGKRDVILAGINEINSKTNLCLVQRTNETDYVEFVSQKGHWSALGRMGGRQEISIDQNDPYVPITTPAHEIMHAAGFSHTQSREDRDRYVAINFRNIESGKEHNFERLTDKATNIGPYDFTSIMHYPATAFARRPGTYTINIKGSGDISKMGKRLDDLAPGDIAGIATAYAPGPCKPGGKQPTPTPQPTPAPTQPTTTGTDNTGNIAIGKKAYQGTNPNPQNGSDADKAIDGNTDGRFDAGSVTNTGEGPYLWWEVDLGAVFDVSNIVVWNRTDECCWNWQQNFSVATGEVSIQTRQSGGGTVGGKSTTAWSAVGFDANNKVNQNLGPFSPWATNKTNFTVPINRKARYIRIFLFKSHIIGDLKPLPGLSLAEVQVFGTPAPTNTRRR